MARTTSEKPATTNDEAQGVAEGIATSEAEAGGKMKAYVSDRNLAEVNAGVPVWLDPESEIGARMLATGYFTEVEDPA